MSPWLSGQLLRSLSDERLAALAGEGHDRAFALLVERYRRSLLSFARGLGAGGRAEDIVQQAFMQAWVALREGAEVTHVRGWLHQIARRATWRATVPLTDELPATLAAAWDTESEVERRLETEWLLTALDDLPERQRDALVQTALHGRSGPEVADGLGLSENALRQLLFRARTTLRATAGAVLPSPLVAWAAARGPSSVPMGERVAELVAAGGSAGVIASVVKTAAIVAVAGTAVAGGTAVRHDHGSAQAGSAATAAARSSPRVAPLRVAHSARLVAPLPAARRPGAVVATASFTRTRRAGVQTGKPAGSTSGVGSGSAPGRPQRRVPAVGAAPQASTQTPSKGADSGDGTDTSATSHGAAPDSETSREPDGSGSGSGSGSDSGSGSGSGSSSGGGGQGPSEPGAGEDALQATPAEVPVVDDEQHSEGPGGGGPDPQANKGPGSGSGSGHDEPSGDDTLP